MDPLPLSKVSTLNTIQILKKYDDKSFIKVIQTCRRLYGIAHQIGKKAKRYPPCLLSVFAYYDKKEKKVMFDVPSGEIRKKKGVKVRAEDFFRRIFKMRRRNDPIETEEGRYCYWLRQTDETCIWLQETILEGNPTTQFYLRRSDRKKAYHTKMTAQQLGELLQLFRFTKVTIDTNNENYLFVRIPRPPLHPKRFLIAEEVLKLFPFIQANALSLYNPDSADLFHRTILTAYQCFKFKKFRYRYAIDPYNPNNPYGHVEQFKVDWHSLKEFKVQCLEENLASIYRDLIQRWKSGRTRLKRLELHVTNSKNFSENFQSPAVLLQMPAYDDQDTFHYIHSVCNNRWDVSYCCLFYKTVVFCDISDCDGGQFPTEFCYKKLIEVISKSVLLYTPVDWDTVLNEWTGRREKAMEDLGKLLKRLMKPHHEKLVYYCFYIMIH